MKKRAVCIISGRVQGVLYRAFVRDFAKKLGINGEVENLPDGTVRVEVEGDEEKLKVFCSNLEKGSAFSKVDEVRCDYSENLFNFKNFRIKYGNFFDRF